MVTLSDTEDVSGSLLTLCEHSFSPNQLVICIFFSHPVAVKRSSLTWIKAVIFYMHCSFFGGGMWFWLMLFCLHFLRTFLLMPYASQKIYYFTSLQWGRGAEEDMSVSGHTSVSLSICLSSLGFCACFMLNRSVMSDCV